MKIEEKKINRDTKKCKVYLLKELEVKIAKRRDEDGHFVLQFNLAEAGSGGR